MIYFTKRIQSVLIVSILAFFFLTLTVVAQEPVKVFLLAGQSNMEGYGYASWPAKEVGTLTAFLNDPAKRPEYEHLVNANDQPIERSDVWVYNHNDDTRNLGVGLGSNYNRIGPELGFGWAAGDHFGEQVLIIKAAWGGKSLAVDFRPPGSSGSTGIYYTEMIDKINDVLNNISSYFPDYNGQGYEVIGFGWHQGWNDRVNTSHVNEYEENLAHLIRDVRNDLNLPNLPFVVAGTGMGGWDLNETNALKLLAAQEAVSTYSEFQGNVFYVETRGFYRSEAESPEENYIYHWNGNFETYYLIGTSMADKLIGDQVNCAAPEPGVTGTSVNSISLTWNNADADSYIVYYKTTNGSWVTAVSGLTGTSYTLTGLADNTAYDIAVRSICPDGTYPYNIISASTSGGSDGDDVTINDVLGQYVRQPPTNSWHTGTISMVGNTLQWENQAGVSWPLFPDLDEGKLFTNEECPYFEADGGDAFTLVLDQNNDGSVEVEGFMFLGEFYSR